MSISFDQERAPIWMVGTPDSINQDSFKDGPTPYGLELVARMQEKDIIVGKNRRGETIVAEQLLGGKLEKFTIE